MSSESGDSLYKVSELIYYCFAQNYKIIGTCYRVNCCHSIHCLQEVKIE